jgi:hypothetical protein
VACLGEGQVEDAGDAGPGQPYGRHPPRVHRPRAEQQRREDLRAYLAVTAEVDGLGAREGVPERSLVLRQIHAASCAQSDSWATWRILLIVSSAATL